MMWEGNTVALELEPPAEHSEFDEVEIEQSKVKSLIEFSINKAEGRAKMNVEVTTKLC